MAIIEIKSKITNRNFTVTLAKYDESQKKIIMVKKLDHIYRNLNAICVNKEVFLRCPDWKVLMVSIGQINYSISREEYDKFDKMFNTYMTYGTERQSAIAIAMFDKINALTDRIEKNGSTVLEFINIQMTKNPYQEWEKRLNINKSIFSGV